MPETRSISPLVWIDCEMTGLNPSTDTILSLACYLTDADLNLLDPLGFETQINHTQSQLSTMSQWCISTHSQSGLTTQCLNSTTTAEEASTHLLAYIKQYIPEPRTALLAGNSVHADKMFLMQAPWNQVLDHLHYRILDVSAIKEAARRWAPESVLEKTPAKAGRHEAKADVLESIEEGRFYREALFLGAGRGGERG